jgi:capsular polysaccharide biosynthesis protein
VFDWQTIDLYKSGTAPEKFEQFLLPADVAPDYKRNSELTQRYFLPPSQILGDQTRFKYPPKSQQRDFIPELIQVGQCIVAGWRSLLTQSNIYTDEYSGIEAINRIKLENTSGYFEGFILEDQTESTGHYSIALQVPEQRLRIEGEVVFVGSLEPNNYGSFLLRTLPKLLYLKKHLKPGQKILLNMDNPWVPQFLDLLDIQAERINLPKGPVRLELEHAFMVTSSYNEGFMSAATLEALCEMTKDVAPAESKKIWISRIHRRVSAPNYRPLVNEVELTEYAAARGFDIVNMETLSVIEQIALMKGANVVAGPSGSGLLNTLFCRAGTKIIELESFTHCIRQHGRLYSSCGHDYIEVFGEIIESQNNLVSSPWSVRSEDILPYLEKWQ